MPLTTTKKAWAALAITLISSAEGMVTYAYRDPVGIPTICFGHTAQVKMGESVTPNECSDMLTLDVQQYGAMVQKDVKVPLNDNQLAAFTSFTYNVGEAKFKKSTLLKKLNAGDYTGACKGLLQWVYAGGIRLPGLVKRRQNEAALCLTPMSGS